jgi:hypothetical protein
LSPGNRRLEALVDWAGNLYRTVSLPDARLEKRLLTIAQMIAAKPLDSINQACDNWASAKAAYRFIENNAVTPDSLIEPIRDAAARDCGGLEAVIAVQDTTVLSFDRARQAKGLGPVNDSTEARGMLLHPAMALRLDGAPLGLLDLQHWCRDLEPPDDQTKAKRSIEEKESGKWLRGIRASRQAIESNLPEEADIIGRPRLIHVFDREGDIHDVFDLVLAGGDGAVIRSSQNRRVMTGDGRGALAHNAVRIAPLLGTTDIDVPRKQGQKKRRATVEARACKLRLTPQREGPDRPRWFELNLVEILEVNAPEDATPLHWLLWTTEPVESLANALEIVRIYKLRWKIEEFNLILKSGCRIEELQFETADRLAKVVALYSPVAVRILQLREWSRLEPEAPCTVVLTDDQWRSLWTYIHRKRPASGASPPSIKQATLWIGRLGGHLGRKSDGMPGVRALWRGWRDLDLLSAMFAIDPA